ncbi:hypothetical protein QD712_09185 [Streptomyces acidiscabies]|uniref:hypothetical protein n=1 Tax=Streptomyces acidiscabies TaxID=42234 RepID=UPI0030CE5D26
MWIELGVDDRSVVDALARRGWAVRPGHLFRHDTSRRGAIRVTTSTLTAPQAEAFSTELAAVVTELS